MITFRRLGINILSPIHCTHITMITNGRNITRYLGVVIRRHIGSVKKMKASRNVSTFISSLEQDYCRKEMKKGKILQCCGGKIEEVVPGKLYCTVKLHFIYACMMRPFGCLQKICKCFAERCQDISIWKKTFAFLKKAKCQRQPPSQCLECTRHQYLDLNSSKGVQQQTYFRNISSIFSFELGNLAMPI